jgi:hypothetical protein
MKIFSLLALMGMADALDLMFDHIQCDTSLPAYAYEDDITMECSGEKKCSFGDTALISGNSKFRLKLMHVLNLIHHREY